MESRLTLRLSRSLSSFTRRLLICFELQLGNGDPYDETLQNSASHPVWIDGSDRRNVSAHGGKSVVSYCYRIMFKWE
jgi:hypothetical protein